MVDAQMWADLRSSGVRTLRSRPLPSAPTSGSALFPPPHVIKDTDSHVSVTKARLGR